MPIVLTPQEQAQVEAVLEELALSINDAINAVTPAEKLAAKNRFKAAMRAHGKLTLNLVRAGLQGDYV